MLNSVSDTRRKTILLFKKDHMAIDVTSNLVVNAFTAIYYNIIVNNNFTSVEPLFLTITQISMLNFNCFR